MRYNIGIRYVHISPGAMANSVTSMMLSVVNSCTVYMLISPGNFRNKTNESMEV